MINLPSSLTAITHPTLTQHGVRLWLKRDDLIHDDISGNKWRKLKYALKDAQEQGYTTLLTFGGAYSNHILATAAAAQMLGLRCIGIIRGEAAYATNPTLSKAQQLGMELDFISRQAYKTIHQQETINTLQKKWGNFYLIPEGGASTLALAGCQEIAEEVHQQLSHEIDLWVLPCGTGATLAGLLLGTKQSSQAIAFAALRANQSQKVKELLANIPRPLPTWKILESYTFGGYAKYDMRLIDFINNFKTDTGIRLDPIYTGKMMYGLFEEVKNNAFNHKNIVAIHTGGLQGIAGFNNRYGNLLEL